MCTITKEDEKTILKYLFFDIEASEGKSICSFGYVICDEAFVVEQKKDILINPQARFCTKPHKKTEGEKHVGIDLAYPEKVFYSQPAFDKLYSKIKNIVEDKDIFVVGFAHINDARYLKVACERYNKPYINYRFFDLQHAYGRYKEEKDQYSLERVMEELGVKNDSLVLHKSDDDALLSMLATKAFCQKLGVTIQELIARFPASCGETREGIIYSGGVDVSVKKPNVSALASYAVISYGKKLKTSLVNDALSGKRFCFCSGFLKKEPVEAVMDICYICYRGGKFSTDVNKCDYFLAFCEHSNSPADKYNVAAELIKRGANIRVLDKASFHSLLGVTQNDINEFSALKTYKIRTRIEGILSQKD